MARRSHNTKLGIRMPGQREPHQQEAFQSLEIVIKCDSVGSLEAVIPLVRDAADPQVKIDVIHSDVGLISKSDLQMALTGSRLVIGFNVDIMPQIEHISREKGIEVRIYNVIYQLANDLREIASRLIPQEEEEETTGEAKVIALFKSSRGGIILGCEVLKGVLTLGDNFRVISAMGPKYTGKIESLHIEKDAVKEAKKGQQAGLKISNFKDVKIGDIVECFEVKKQGTRGGWRPVGGVFRY
jgi:translation initiation factor IF-2